MKVLASTMEKAGHIQTDGSLSIGGLSAAIKSIRSACGQKYGTLRTSDPDGTRHATRLSVEAVKRDSLSFERYLDVPTFIRRGVKLHV